VSVLTLNVQNAAADRNRSAAIAEVISSVKPDLVSLQEVANTSGGHRPLDDLLVGTSLTGTHQSDVMAYTPPFADRYGGTALASRWPHEVVEVMDLRLLDAPDVPWCTLAAIVELPVGTLLFIATTTSWRLDAEASRERQALAIADLDARHRTALPTMIAGDLNAAPDASSVRFLTGKQSLAGRSVLYHDAWDIAGDGPGYTWDAANPVAAAEIDQIVRQPGHRRRIDYILLGSWHAHPDASARVRAAEMVFDESPVSDHFGVYAVIDIDT
jgi:endonuclease/exonuclease/phosphatase family metal-dependent hydrolase